MLVYNSVFIIEVVATCVVIAVVVIVVVIAAVVVVVVVVVITAVANPWVVSYGKSYFVNKNM